MKKLLLVLGLITSMATSAQASTSGDYRFSLAPALGFAGGEMGIGLLIEFDVFTVPFFQDYGISLGGQTGYTNYGEATSEFDNTIGNNETVGVFPLILTAKYKYKLTETLDLVGGVGLGFAFTMYSASTTATGTTSLTEDKTETHFTWMLQPGVEWDFMDKMTITGNVKLAGINDAFIFMPNVAFGWYF